MLYETLLIFKWFHRSTFWQLHMKEELIGSIGRLHIQRCLAENMSWEGSSVNCSTGRCCVCSLCWGNGHNWRCIIVCQRSWDMTSIAQCWCMNGGVRQWWVLGDLWVSDICTTVIGIWQSIISNWRAIISRVWKNTSLGCNCESN